MEEPKSLDSLFKEKIFRIPDYQRGYDWQREQLKDFWEDLINLSGDRSHYTGVLTLKQIPVRDIAKSAKEFWLVDDHSYRVHHIVDEDVTIKSLAQLRPTEIRDFVNSLKESAVHWFNSFYPDLATGISADERQWIDRLNRVSGGGPQKLDSVLSSDSDHSWRI